MKESAGDKSDHLSLGSDPDHYDQPLSELGHFKKSPSNSNESLTHNSAHVALQNQHQNQPQISQEIVERMNASQAMRINEVNRQVVNNVEIEN